MVEIAVPKDIVHPVFEPVVCPVLVTPAMAVEKRREVFINELVRIGKLDEEARKLVADLFQHADVKALTVTTDKLEVTLASPMSGKTYGLCEHHAKATLSFKIGPNSLTLVDEDAITGWARLPVKKWEYHLLGLTFSQEHGKTFVTVQMRWHKDAVVEKKSYCLSVSKVRLLMKAFGIQLKPSNA